MNHNNAGARGGEPGADGRGVLGAVMGLAAVVPVMALIAPLVVGALINGYGFSVRQAAFTLSAELGAMSLATLPALWWLPRYNWRTVVRVSLVVMVLANLLSMGAKSFALLASLRLVSGLAGGSIMLVTLAVIGMTRQQERNFGLWAVGQLVFAAIGLSLLPRVLSWHGLGALYAALAVLLALLFPGAGWLPRRSVPVPVPAVAAGTVAGRLSLASLAGFAGILVFYVALSGVWAYLERIGAQGGLPATRIGDDLTIASLFGIIGSASAVVLGGLWGRKIPLLLGYVLLVGSVAFFYIPVQQGTYLMAACLFKYSWTFTLPYLLACIAVRDAAGRLLSIANLMIGTGLAVGPTVVALLLGETADFHQALRVGIVCGLVSLMFMAVIEFSRVPRQEGLVATPAGRSGASALVILGLLCALLGQGGAARAADEYRFGTGLAGQQVFIQHCASCHADTGASRPGEGRAPTLNSLQQLPSERILDALTTGKMAAVGAQLGAADRQGVAEWLGGRPLGAADAGEAGKMSNPCTTAAPVGAPAAGDWNGWGNGERNLRFQPLPGFDSARVPRLKLLWAFGLPGGAEAYSQPTVVSGHVYIGGDNGYVYAIQARSGCVEWSFRTKAGVRTAPTVASPGQGRMAVYFGDVQGYAYAVDAANGRSIWTRRVDGQPTVKITGAPTVLDGRVYVPITTGEEVTAAPPNYPCCRTRGSVVALNAATGKVLWKTYMVPEKARPLGKNSAGTVQWGPAGVGVWNAPTIDVARGRVYVGTGDAYTAPAAALADSMVALERADGRVLWHYQATPADAWLAGCMPGRSFGNCPATLGPDWDFGDSPILVSHAGADRLVGATKGGLVMAVDPARHGELVWSRNVAEQQPGAGGEIVFGGASDGENVYYGTDSGAVMALSVADGRTLWRNPVTPAHPDRKGFSAAVSVMPGVLFAGGWDGVVRAFATGDGHQLWSFDTARAFKTVNGVEAKGGSLGAPGPTLAEGMLFVASGYIGVNNGMPGNVLLAFAPE